MNILPSYLRFLLYAYSRKMTLILPCTFVSCLWLQIYLCLIFGHSMRVDQMIWQSLNSRWHLNLKTLFCIFFSHWIWRESLNAEQLYTPTYDPTNPRFPPPGSYNNHSLWQSVWWSNCGVWGGQGGGANLIHSMMNSILVKIGNSTEMQIHPIDLEFWKERMKTTREEEMTLAKAEVDKVIQVMKLHPSDNRPTFSGNQG